MTLRGHLEKIRKLTPAKVESDLLVILKKNEAIATGMVTDQLFEGKTSRGDDLPDYSPVSVNVFGKRPGPWQLFETGDFYRGIFMDAGKFPVLFDSSDSKTDQIFAHLERKGVNSDEVLGLDSANKKELARAYLLKETQDYFRRNL